MPKIFISYRRRDSEAEVTHLYADLKDEFGEENVFFDSRTLNPGERWNEAIESHLTASDVVLVIMGREWSQLNDTAAPHRLMNAQDVYRREIATALARTPRPLVIPLALSGVTMPAREAVPDDIADLTAFQKQDLRNSDWEIDCSKLIKAIDAGLPEDVATGSSIAAYRTRILDETCFVSLSGIPQPRDRQGRPLQLRVPLDAIYVRVLAIEEARVRAKENEERQLAAGRRGAPSASAFGGYLYRRKASSGTAADVDAIDPEAVLRNQKAVVIVGAPGAGKSTLLRYLARRAAKSNDESLPLLISLREYGTARAASGALTLREFALAHVCRGDRKLQRALERRVGNGRVLWLLDGLDEARLGADQIARECAHLPGKVVLTSRPIGYQGAGLERLPHYEILPLSAADVDEFLRHWFEILAAERGGPYTPAQLLETFKAQMDHRPELEQFVRNPLMLTFLAILAGEDPSRELPAQRTEVYRRYVEELMDRRETQRHSASGEGTPDARQATLKGFHVLGWYLHLAYYGARSDEPPTRRRIVAALASYLTATAHANAETVAETVTAYWLEAGMLDIWTLEGEEYLAFRHLTFQEYAVSHVLADLWRKDASYAWRFLRPRLHHYAWREPVLMMSALVGTDSATNVARRLLSARSRYERLLHRDLLLAASLLGEGSQIGEASAKRIVEHLQSLSRRPVPRRFRRLSITYACGLLLALAVAWSALPGWGLFGVALLWTFIWIAAFRRPVWFLRHVFTLPLRIRPQVLDRAAVIAALARTRRIEVLPDLAAALGGDRDDVRQAAALGLARFGRPALPQVTQALRTSSARAAALALGQMGSAVIPDVIGLMKDSQAGVRAGAVRAAEYLRDVRLAPALVALLSDPVATVRRMAADAIAAIRDPGAADALLKALGDEPEVAAAAAHALGAIGDPKAVTSLAATVRQTARSVVDDYYDQINYPVDFVQPPPIWDVHAAASEALGRIGGIEAVDALIEGLRLRYPASVACAPALARIGDPRGIAALVEALKSGDSNFEHSARDAIGVISDPRALPALVNALKEAELGQFARAAIVNMLRRIAPPQHLTEIAQELRASDHADARTAAAALELPGRAEAVESPAATDADPAPGSADAAGPLLLALSDREPHARATAAKALAELSERLSDVALVHRIERALWWRLTDPDADVMLAAFARVAGRATALEVHALPFADPLLTTLPHMRKAA